MKVMLFYASDIKSEISQLNVTLETGAFKHQGTHLDQKTSVYY